MSSGAGANGNSQSEPGEEVPLVEFETEAEDGTGPEGEDVSLCEPVVEVIGREKIEEMVRLLDECSARMNELLRPGGFEVEAVRNLSTDLSGVAEGFRLHVEVRMRVRKGS